MANEVSRTPLLPRTPGQATLQNLLWWAGDLTKQLFTYLGDLARRANATLPKDGSEAMTGALDMGGFAITNVGAVGLEGTFTPIVSGITLAGAGTYTQQIGNYIRIGNLVFVWGIVSWSAHTGTGNARLGGLPITVANIANPGFMPVFPINYTFTGYPVLSFGANTLTADLLEATSGAFAPVALDTVAGLSFHGFYKAA